MTRIFLATELELEPRHFIFNSGQFELSLFSPQFPGQEPSQSQIVILESLHHANLVLHIFTPVLPNQPNSLTIVGLFVVCQEFSFLAAFLLTMYTQISLCSCHVFKQIFCSWSYLNTGFHP